MSDTLCKLSIVIPCYNEENTLEECIHRVLDIQDSSLSLEIIIVDDCSTDKSYSISKELENRHPEIVSTRHEKNSGKGAALRTGFKLATGDFVAVQDADLEYDPNDLKRLIVPLREGKADVVLGSRFLSTGLHRVLYFWHYMGNRFLTFLSNMFTDLNLTDMETCYKVFLREVIQNIEIKENRFGFEPEIVAKISQLRLRIYEMGISYYGRTYEEGKKIVAKDGFRALYCIFRYNAHKAPFPIQSFIYLFIGGVSALFNLGLFSLFFYISVPVSLAASSAFLLAAALNYLICIAILFRHKARWTSITEIGLYLLIVFIICLFDLAITKLMISIGVRPIMSKLVATISVFILNFLSRRYIIFPESSAGPWKPQSL